MDPRRKTWELCQQDIDEAAQFARRIDDEWYRCQSLAAVALHTPDKKAFMKLANEALDAARQLPNPNRKVTCSAWIISAMAKRHDVDVSEVVKEMLETIETDDNPVRRADALLPLFEAVYSRPEIRTKVFEPLFEAAKEMRSWKQPIKLGDIVLVLAKDELEQAQMVLELIADRGVRSKTERSIISREWLGPHEFFPYYSKVTEAKLVR